MTANEQLEAAFQQIADRVSEDEKAQLQQAIGAYVQSQTQEMGQKVHLILQEKKEELLERMDCGHPKCCLEVRGESGQSLGADALYEMKDEDIRPVCIVCEELE